ncbi:HAD-IA family hydrolase [Oceanibium sediminis]|uniref:HAD-IA family hydrolase n=1 Tax=Oceanibium sediminis TaxID=2026339 RepID=UPI000DD44F42|nr:HAD family phosphatase [Oceanibium sediminis]
MTENIDTTLDSIDLVIFDCDGVLIDSEKIASRTLSAALGKAGIEMSPQQVFLRFIGNSVGDIKLICEKNLGLKDADRVFTDWAADLLEEFARSLRTMDGIEDAVSAIGRPKCVASNSGMVRLRRSLGLFELWKAFEGAVYSAESVARPKPAPDLLFHCAEQFGADPRACVMIDDNVHGIIAAREAGMIPVGFIDPEDPRPARLQVLREAGAVACATGAAELHAALELAAAHVAEGQVKAG